MPQPPQYVRTPEEEAAYMDASIEQIIAEELTVIDGTVVDAEGNPWIPITGCPNCGRLQDGDEPHMHPILYAGARNAGRDPNGPCSRSCALQLEHAAALHGNVVDAEVRGVI